MLQGPADQMFLSPIAWQLSVGLATWSAPYSRQKLPTLYLDYVKDVSRPRMPDLSQR